MSLITQIKAIITQVSPGATSILSSKFNANYQAFLTETYDLPLIIIDNEQPKTPEIKINNNVIKDTKIEIMFLALDSNDNTDDQTQVVIDSMEDLADLIAVRIYQLEEIRPVNRQRYKVTPLYRVMASQLSGIRLEIQCNYNCVINFE
jgi:hypothetical protein